MQYTKTATFTAISRKYRWFNARCTVCYQTKFGKRCCTYSWWTQNIKKGFHSFHINLRIYLIFFKIIFQKTHSTRDRKRSSIKKNKPLFRDPPIITTTAATPQDSPNCTLEQGATFKDWDILNFDNVDRISVSLKIEVQ